MNVSPESPANTAPLLDRLKTVFDTCLQQFTTHAPNISVEDMDRWISRLERRVGNTNSSSQFATLLCSMSSSMPALYRCGSQIRTQLTSQSRRRAGITTGAKRQPAGRPAKGTTVSVKRSRNLSLNIHKNQPNAKSHGYGH